MDESFEDDFSSMQFIKDTPKELSSKHDLGDT